MKLKKGFTLIELVVVIALIAILAVTLAPRLRDQIAKANDAKAIALLGSMRTSSEIYFADNGTTLGADNGVAAALINAGALTDLEEGLDSTAIKLLNEGSDYYAPVGGSRSTEDGDLTYGGEVSYTFAAPTGSTADGISMWFGATSPSGQNFDTKKNAWASY